MTTPEATAGEWMSAEELAHHLHVDRSTIYRLVKLRRIPSVKLSPGKTGARRFNVADVEAALREDGDVA